MAIEQYYRLSYGMLVTTHSTASHKASELPLATYFKTPRRIKYTVNCYRITSVIRPWPCIRYKAIWRFVKSSCLDFKRPWPSISVIRLKQQTD